VAARPVNEQAGSSRTTPRTILHVDMDAFYVSVELRRRPELRGKPVVVGGDGLRGVVAAASYEARRFGVHSAMASAQAKRLCPQAIFLAGDHAHYAEVSSAVFDVFHDVTPLVEGLSLDEAFLDCTGSLRLLGSGRTIATSIRQQILERLGLSCSVGIAPNKFLAKLASEAAKPVATASGVRPGPGVVEVAPGEELHFLHPLKVQAMWGVGPATLERLHRLGVETIGDLAALPPSVVIGSLGNASGTHLSQLAQAIDDRPVVPDRGAKSIGHEETFPRDLFDDDEIRHHVVRLADAVGSRLRGQGVGARTVTLKLRFAGFQTITRSHTSPTPLTTGPAIAAVVLPLLEAIDTSIGVRLLGVSGSNLDEPREQLTLDLGGEPAGDPAAVERAWQEASGAIDALREKFGAAIISPASSLRAGKVRPVRTGAQQWGPTLDPPTDPPPAENTPKNKRKT
jgi:DNA polymerase IV